MKYILASLCSCNIKKRTLIVDLKSTVSTGLSTKKCKPIAWDFRHLSWRLPQHSCCSRTVLLQACTPLTNPSIPYLFTCCLPPTPVCVGVCGRKAIAWDPVCLLNGVSIDLHSLLEQSIDLMAWCGAWTVVSQHLGHPTSQGFRCSLSCLYGSIS